MSASDERRLSLNGRNAYISLIAESVPKNINDPNYNRNYLTAKPERAKSCSPALIKDKQALSPINSSGECNTKENKKNNNITHTTTPVLKSTEVNMQTKAFNRPLEFNSSESCNVNNPAKTVSMNDGTSKGAIPKVRNEGNSSNTAVLTGMLRYVSINKRYLSPQKQESSSSLKKQKTYENPLRNNRFAILSEDMNNKQKDKENQIGKPLKPPPIFLREASSSNLVNIFIKMIGKENFHIVPLKKGGVQETKVVIYTEDNYRKISQYLNNSKKNFYTYQLKSSKGLIVVIKGIESSVEPAEIKEALEELGFKTKVVVNIFNRDRVPQPLFRVELDPEDKKIKGNEIHPIYSLRYLLNRRINVEEPLKRKSPVQCSNCQEFGHTKNYCTLRTVCVACGDLHPSSQCDIIKQGLRKKCGNCGGDHTANYRGCPVYKALLKRLRERQKLLRGEIVDAAPANSENNPVLANTGTSFPSMPINKTNRDFQQQNNQASSKFDSSSYANVLRTGKNQSSVPQNLGGLDNVSRTGKNQSSVPQNVGGLDNLIFSLTQSVTSLNQNMSNFMTSMQNTIQELLRAQNQMIQILLTRK